MKKTLSYKDKLNAIKDYTSLNINSSKYRAKNPNFSKTEKWLISRYYNISREKGFFEYNSETNEFIPKVKFTKSKKKKQKGGPRFKGYFTQGANPGDKIRGNKIIKANYEKLQIPMDFSKIIMSDKNFDEKVYNIVFAAVSPFMKQLTSGTYFTIYLQNGWELGQKKSARRKKAKLGYADGQAIAQDLTGPEKIENLYQKILEQLKQGINKYDMGTLALVAGVYFWKFKNQRRPNKKELKAIKGRKRRK